MRPHQDRNSPTITAIEPHFNRFTESPLTGAGGVILIVRGVPIDAPKAQSSPDGSNGNAQIRSLGQRPASDDVPVTVPLPVIANAYPCL